MREIQDTKAAEGQGVIASALVFRCLDAERRRRRRRRIHPSLLRTPPAPACVRARD